MHIAPAHGSLLLLQGGIRTAECQQHGRHKALHFRIGVASGALQPAGRALTNRSCIWPLACMQSVFACTLMAPAHRSMKHWCTFGCTGQACTVGGSATHPVHLPHRGARSTLLLHTAAQRQMGPPHRPGPPARRVHAAWRRLPGHRVPHLLRALTWHGCRAAMHAISHSSAPPAAAAHQGKRAKAR